MLKSLVYPRQIAVSLSNMNSDVSWQYSLKKSQPAEYFNNDTWFAHVAYRADIFDQLNAFNLSLWGRGYNCFEQADKTVALGEIYLCTKYVSNDRIDKILFSTKTILERFHETRSTDENNCLTKPHHNFQMSNSRAKDMKTSWNCTKPPSHLNVHFCSLVQCSWSISCFCLPSFYNHFVFMFHILVCNWIICLESTEDLKQGQARCWAQPLDYADGHFTKVRWSSMRSKIKFLIKCKLPFKLKKSMEIRLFTEFTALLNLLVTILECK